MLYNWILRLIRKRDLKKRENIADDVLKLLRPEIAEKKKKQKSLIEKIKKNYLKDTGIKYGSKFIPTQEKNYMHIATIISNKYGEEMAELDVILYTDLTLKCM